MHVTLVSPFDPDPERSHTGEAHVGGVERVFSQLSLNLALHGHDVRLLCSTDGPGRNTREGGVETVRVPRAGTLFRAPLVRLASHLDPETDLVHVPATYPFTTPSVLRAADRLGLPTILDFHFEPELGSLLGQAAAGLYRRLATRTYRRADRVLVNSREYARSIPSLDHVATELLREVPNGIDPDRFHAEGPAEAGDYLLFVGRLVPYKGLGVLLEALAGLEDVPPLRVAGAGPRREALDARARELDVDARFLGYVDGDRLGALYRGARWTVLPSVNQQEAFGICLLESMACGTPVVASGLPGVRQVAREGGYVVEPGDVSDLRNRLREALAYEDVPRGPALAERIHDRYAWDAVTERVLSVYEEVLEVAGPSPLEAPPSEEEEAPWTS
jgi:glycosyltransferase involved in cell wall biosynthesis